MFGGGIFTLLLYYNHKTIDIAHLLNDEILLKKRKYVNKNYYIILK